MKTLITIVAFLLLFVYCGAVVAEDVQKERFQKADESIVIDTETGLMWAMQDNGSDIDWWDAEKYCENYTAGGHSDWRLPDIKELATLYTENQKNSDGYAIAGPITLTDCCIWSSYDVLGAAIVFSFKSGRKTPVAFHETYQLRALPVRGTSKIDLKKYKNF